MKSRIVFVLLSLVFMILTTACVREDENHHRTIRFVNNSNRVIYVYESFNYPDTLNGNNMGGGGASYPDHYKIAPNTENSFALQMREFYEVIFRGGKRIPSDTLMVFVFDAELLESHETIVPNTVIQRYDLSLQDLQYVNWVLTYPPSPNMSSIKMSPQYYNSSLNFE